MRDTAAKGEGYRVTLLAFLLKASGVGVAGVPDREQPRCHRRVTV